MGFKPWLRWGFVVVSGVTLGGCQSPAPTFTPPAPTVGRQTLQQPPAPNFPGTATSMTPSQNLAPTNALTPTANGQLGNLGPANRTSNSSLTPSNFTTNPAGLPGVPRPVDPRTSGVQGFSPPGAPTINPLGPNTNTVMTTPQAAAFPPAAVTTPGLGMSAPPAPPMMPASPQIPPSAFQGTIPQ